MAYALRYGSQDPVKSFCSVLITLVHNSPEFPPLQVAGRKCCNIALVSVDTVNYEMLVKAWPLRFSHYHRERLSRAGTFLGGVSGWRTSTSPLQASVAGKAALAVQTGMNRRFMGRRTPPREIIFSYENAVTTACFALICSEQRPPHLFPEQLFTNVRAAEDTRSHHLSQPMMVASKYECQTVSQHCDES